MTPAGKDNQQKWMMFHVCQVVQDSLVSHLFPKRLHLWKSIKDSKELKAFILSAFKKFLLFLERHSKGKEIFSLIPSLARLHAYFYMSFATYSLCTCHDGITKTKIWFEIQRTVIVSILHVVEEGIQSKMSCNIEALNSEPLGKTELPVDEAALYRVSGWALKSCVDNTEKCLKQKKTWFKLIPRLHWQ